jgi:hypothetical protein
MLSKSFMGHKLSNKQSLLRFTATSNQIRQSLTPQAPHRSRFLLITVLPYSFFKMSLNILVISHHFNKALKKKGCTRNWRESGQARRLNRLTAIQRSLSSFPL